jgi:hypothetical protein
LICSSQNKRISSNLRAGYRHHHSAVVVSGSASGVSLAEPVAAGADDAVVSGMAAGGAAVSGAVVSGAGAVAGAEVSVGFSPQAESDNANMAAIRAERFILKFLR